MNTQRKKLKESEYLLPFIKTKKGRITLVSTMSGLVLLVVFLVISDLTGNFLYSNAGIVLGLLTGMLPYVLMEMKDRSRKADIDKNLPVFLLSLVSAVESGTSLLRSLEDAADRNYGPLTPQLKNFRANISWGTPLNEAFDNLSMRLGTKLGTRVITLLETSIHMGGDVVKTLNMIQKHITNIQNLEKERISTLKPYTVTIYISFFIFIGITILLIVSFFSELELVQESLLEEAGEEGALPLGMFQSMIGLDVDAIKNILFHMAIIESILGGIVAGKISEGTYVSGIKHSIIMVILTVVAFSAITVAEVM